MYSRIVISTDVIHLPEVGEAWLIADDGTPRAKFYNGEMERPQPRVVNEDVTLEAA